MTNANVALQPLTESDSQDGPAAHRGFATRAASIPVERLFDMARCASDKFKRREVWALLSLLTCLARCRQRGKRLIFCGEHSPPPTRCPSRSLSCPLPSIERTVVAHIEGLAVCSIDVDCIGKAVVAQATH